MKNILAGILILALSGNCAYALSASQQATFTVTVNSVFELSIDQGLIDFGRMDPGDEKNNIPSRGLTVTSRTNSGNPWYLKINSSSPFSSGDKIIPYSSFRWTGWTDGSGVWFGTNNKTVSASPVLAYSSGAGEESNLPNGTLNHFKFKLNVPKIQAPGVYTTMVKFTMTE